MSTWLISLTNNIHFSFDFSRYFPHLASSHFDLRAVKSLPATPFWILVSIFVLFDVYYFIKGYRSFVLARTIEDIPTAKIRSAAQGYVELQGIQKCLPTIHTVAPLSNLPCTWYRYVIEHYSQKRWMPIEQGISSQTFLLDDGTGTCRIDPTHADITTPIYDCWQGFHRHPKGKPYRFFERFLSGFGTYRYHEWRMYENMPLYAAGFFETIDENGHPINTLHQKGLIRQPFVLSARPAQKLVRSFKLTSLGFFLAYLAVLAFTIWLIINRIA